MTAKINQVNPQRQAGRPNELHNADLVKIIHKVLDYIRFKMPI